MARDQGRQAAQERTAAQPILALLLGQGHAVTNLRRPDLTGGRSPDFLFELDGVTVALEVVRYLDRAEAQKALSRVLLVEQAVQARLAPDAIALGGKIVIDMRYMVEELVRHKRRDVAVDADQLSADVRAALGSQRPDPAGLVSVSTTVGWIIDAQVGVFASLEPGAYFGIAPGLIDGKPDPDGFLDRTILSKADQHIGHAERAILAVLGMFHDDAEDLREAIARHPAPLPWWRVYFVRYDATLLFEQSD